MDGKRKAEILKLGIGCFNRQEFFDCHEVLEEVWLAEPPEEKPFYQGLIQVAAAFHHYQRGNRRGSIPKQRNSALASSSVWALVTMVTFIPLIFSTLSMLISGNISCSRTPIV